MTSFLDNDHQLLRFCPRCGAKTFVYDGFKSFTCGTCDFVLYHNSAAAVMAVLTLDDRILLARRAHDPAKGKLDLPGGFVDPDESAEAALRRELKEEMGLVLEAMTYLGSAPNRYAYGGMVYPTCDLVYHSPLDTIPSVLDKTEVSEVVLLKPHEIVLDELAFPSNRAALDLFSAYLNGQSASG